MQNAGDHLEQSAFARAVLADYAECLAGLDLECDVAERPEIPMKGAAIKGSELFETGTGLGVDGITFGDIPKLNNRGRHLLESTGGKKELST
jgi:hypothetical protein